MAKAYQPKRRSLSLKSSVSLAHLLAAREDVCNVVKTSSGTCRAKTTCSVNKVNADCVSVCVCTHTFLIIIAV